jgi:hypothetical protein
VKTKQTQQQKGEQQHVFEDFEHHFLTIFLKIQEIERRKQITKSAIKSEK